VKACLLIPIYDHGARIGGVVESLAPHGLPCLVVDDGSGEETRAVLGALEERHAFLEVHPRKQNGGRGAALKTGYRRAAARGFSHVIQLDADGQHDAADVPRFLAALERDPDSLVLGTPIFDASVPRSRLYGRQLSRAMVWLATLSFRVDDPLCGFRGLPLRPLLELLGEVQTGDHMEFDPELLIHLVWRGLRVQTLPTRVVYDPRGLSHFDPLWDDLRLSGVYARALAALPARAWRALGRRGARREPGR
jgi:glycosyltransferase involved in cell wall biosynthesis